MKNVTILLAVAAVVAMGVPAYGDATADFYFNVANGAWVAPGSWTPTGGPPGTTNSVLIRNDGTATITTGDAAVCNTFRIGDRMDPYPWTYPGGTIYIDGGSLTTSGGSYIGRSSGTVTQDGGTVSLASTTYLGGYGSAPYSGTYNLNAGTLSTAFRIGYNGTNPGHYNQTGGTANIGNLQMEGAANANSATISGGTLAVPHIRINAGGTFHIVGSDAGTITMYGYWHESWGDQYEQQGGTLKVDINAAGTGVTDIKIGGGRTNEKAVFNAGSILDMGLLGSAPAYNTYFLLITAPDGIVDNGLSLAAGDSANWTIKKTATTLGVTYIPEPATMVLLGLGGLGVLLRRRKK